ncbi:hypothetical protein PBY51_015466 [Eleginops maclovinus]|uniref:Uncharacterized protein n=1 Tax=Eleginops maclovinus TaxID=56733 RepID=A0AAN7X5J4_ELEMC|nr:hypothetical protein PBY51_015466 [Eleginops maclovinus]
MTLLYGRHSLTYVFLIAPDGLEQHVYRRWLLLSTSSPRQAALWQRAWRKTLISIDPELHEKEPAGHDRSRRGVKL